MEHNKNKEVWIMVLAVILQVVQIMFFLVGTLAAVKYLGD